ncbi:MAG: UDP-diphosphatase [Micavibrio sp.]|nr:UDP-diphosphatase [Micavibrio sp.]
MGRLESLFLGIIQGLTEFLPVSSSGHLELAKAIFGGDSLPEESMLFTVVVHFATALATILVFRREVVQIISGLFKFKNNQEFRFSINIIISMVPAALVGVFFDEAIEQLFGGQVLLVGFMLLITGILLVFANNAKSGTKSVGPFQAIIIGVAQAIAILPGISRSGATIASSILLGVEREKAARFSFLMVVPLIFGKIAKDLMDGGFAASDGHQQMNILIGFAAAFFTGLWACNWMIEIVKRSNLNYFAIYCFIVGIIAITTTFFI